MWINKPIPLGEVIEHRKEFVTISDEQRYKRCRVQVRARGVVLRDEVDGSSIRTKSQQVCRTGELLVAEIDAKVGGFGMVPPELEGAIVSSHYFLYSINASMLDESYLGYYVKAHQFREQVEAKGTTNYAAIRPKNVLEYTIPLPSLDRQRQIVAKIDDVVGKICEVTTLREEVRKEIDNLPVAMAHRADLSDSEKHKQGWSPVLLSDVLKKVSTPIEVEPDGEYPHFGIYSFVKGLFKKAPLLGDEIKAKKLYQVKKGQFIYGRLNAYEGAFAIINDDYDGHHVSNEFPTFECDLERVLPEYLLAYFSTPVVWETLKRKVTGIGGGAGNRRIRLKESDLLSEEIWLPPIEWQHKIRSTMDNLSPAKNIHKSSEVELDALLPAILDKAFRGELV
ncbi:restriction endonuclease subunit S [Endozoicomonas sp. ALD040]|uniref:restriction endonuclease subunit S n=1 Tax=Endozoicomonas sp. ALD040 TaxID=3403079 RepID=UPI003BB18C71